MNFLKKGPDLKLSELKVPDFLYDLFYDLKERHLLPLVALLLVAMVAAPIYFKSSTKEEPETAATPGAAATGSATEAGQETLVVARSEPGLRDYRRRLKNYRALDPFASHGAGEEVSAPTSEVSSSSSTASTSETSESSASSVEATVVGAESSGSTEGRIEYPSESETSGHETEPSTGTTTVTKTRYASDTIDVRIVTVPHSSAEQKKTKAKPHAQVRRNLPELTMLPARATPAATYIGLTNDGKKALFVVSSDVVSLFGEGTCVIGSQTCQLIALEPGLPETFVYGPAERTYRIELLKIDTTLSSKPHRASLTATGGKANKSKGHSQGGGEGGGANNTEVNGEEPAERG